MPTELNLLFADPSHLIARLGPLDKNSVSVQFVNPITAADLRELQWYVEVYGAHSLGDPDDKEAERISRQLSVWGDALFAAICQTREVQERFNAFRQADCENRLLTVSAEHPAILALPWELLHAPDTEVGFLVMQTPSISIRRRVTAGGGVPYSTPPKDSLHLLFVVSRPHDVGFIDPRGDALPVLDALEADAPGRFTSEFLRPPTLAALLQRLVDDTKPHVDILHFDGHGIFDLDGGLPRRFWAARVAPVQVATLAKKDLEYPPNTGYLLFERITGQADFVSAEKLGATLHLHRVALVILSACQSAAVRIDDAETTGTGEPLADVQSVGTVAARLAASGVPSVLAMTYAVLVQTTRALFGLFYKELANHKTIGDALDGARRYLSNHPEKYDVQRGSTRVPLRLYDWFLPALYQQGSDEPLLHKVENTGPKPIPARGRTNLPRLPDTGFFGRRRELWLIERWFAGPTRRITITGFGGQGKTALAQEAGRWLTRTGLFNTAVYVSYADTTSSDGVTQAMNMIGQELGEHLRNVNDATAALARTSTLVILDHLESLPPEQLGALLDAAVGWSTAGASRVLCTTRQPDFGHADYRVSKARRSTDVFASAGWVAARRRRMP